MIHLSILVTGLAAPVVGACGVLAWRLKETQAPLTLKRIIIPPIAMSTGFAMFFLPMMRVPLGWAAATFLAGATVFAYPLIRTSKLSVRDNEVYLSRSRAFLCVLLGLLAVRLGLREEISRYISAPQTAAMFFILAFGMIVHWRANMLAKFNRLQASILECSVP